MRTFTIIMGCAALGVMGSLVCAPGVNCSRKALAATSGTTGSGTRSAGSGSGASTGSGTTTTVDTSGSSNVTDTGSGTSSTIDTTGGNATLSGSTTSNIGAGNATLGGSTTSGAGTGSTTRAAGSATGGSANFGSTTSGLGSSSSGIGSSGTGSTTGARGTGAAGTTGTTPGTARTGAATTGAAGGTTRATGATPGTTPTTLGTSVGVTAPAAGAAARGTTVPTAAAATGGRTTPGAGAAAGAATAGIARAAAPAAAIGAAAPRAGSSSAGVAPLGPIIIMPLWRAAVATAAAGGASYGSAGQMGTAGAAPPLTVVGISAQSPAWTPTGPSAAPATAAAAAATPAGAPSATPATAALPASPATAAAATATVTAPGVSAPAVAAPPEITVTVSREAPTEPLYVGEPVTLKIVLHNGGSSPVLVPDWDHFADMVAATVRVSGTPGLGGGPAAAAGAPPAPAPWTGAVFQKSDFRPLPPGDTAILRTFVPMLCGKADITVGVRAPSDSYLSLADGKTVRMADAWTGEAAASLTLNISDAESPALKAHLADVRAQLADRLVPADEKGRLLADVAAEQSYPATRFLRTVYDELPAGPLRDMTLGQILRLARVGTAYESVPALLKAMNDPKTNQQVRVGILDWTAEALAAGGKMNLADQGEYIWSADLQKDARAAVEQARSDRNPYLAARARDALRAVDAAKP